MPGANVTQQCLEADLIDEILLVQSPVLLGDCIRLFGRPGYREVLFETILATRYGPNPSNGFPKPTRQCESPWD